MTAAQLSLKSPLGGACITVTFRRQAVHDEYGLRVSLLLPASYKYMHEYNMSFFRYTPFICLGSRRL